MKRAKLLILKKEISSYNAPVYNLIAEKFNLTVAYYLADKSVVDCNFKKIKLQYHQFKSFIFLNGLNKLVKQFEIVSVVPDPHVPGYFLRPFFCRRYKVVTWGIGFRCSYIHPYQTNRAHTLIDKIYEIVYKKADANIFYMNKSKEFWKNSSLDLTKVFVAPNTTEVEPIEIIAEVKQNFLFVGTLYRGKGFGLLLQSYKEAILQTHSDKKLVIVGGGEMKDEIVCFVKENHLEKSVVLTGPIYDEKVLSTYFQNALLCISPTQGGLTCPKSMGYGVPFVCRKDAITGGEIYHMTSGETGIMYDNDSDLKNIFVDAIKNPDRYIEMGMKAKEYYDYNATIKHMTDGAIEAYEYVLHKRK